jgi:hypothetical protein
VLCRELGMQVTDESVVNIAKTLTVDASAEFPEGHPLSPSDRQIAEELVYQSIMACWPGRDMADARSAAKRKVAFGERGRTTFHWMGENIFGLGR